MFRFTRIRNNLYQYRDFDIIISFDEYKNTSMLAKTKDASGSSIQFYAYGSDFERIKGTMICKVNAYLEEQSPEAAENEHEGT